VPIFMEKTIAELERVYINGGRRGLLVAMSPSDLLRVLAPTLVEAATTDRV